jgi:hypothetical protein
MSEDKKDEGEKGEGFRSVAEHGVEALPPEYRDRYRANQSDSWSTVETFVDDGTKYRIQRFDPAEDGPKSDSAEKPRDAADDV